MNSSEEKLTNLLFLGQRPFYFLKKTAVSGEEVIHIWYDRTWEAYMSIKHFKAASVSSVHFQFPLVVSGKHQWSNIQIPHQVRKINYIYELHISFTKIHFPPCTRLYLWNNTSAVKTFGTMYRIIFQTN